MPFAKAVRSWVVAVPVAFVATVPLAEPSLQLRGEKVHEDLRSDALISGNWLVGALTVAPRSQAAPRLLSYVPGGAAWQGATLCARTTDKSGRYSALFEYRTPDDWSGGLIEFEYQSEHPDFLSVADETNSGVALHHGDCRTVTDTFLPVLWNSVDDPKLDASRRSEVVLNINAGRADSLIAKARTATGELEIVCAAADGEGVGFNHQCRIFVPSDFDDVVQVEISRLRYGRASRPLSAELHLYPIGN